MDALPRVLKPNPKFRRRRSDSTDLRLEVVALQVNLGIWAKSFLLGGQVSRPEIGADG